MDLIHDGFYFDNDHDDIELNKYFKLSNII